MKRPWGFALWLPWFVWLCGCQTSPAGADNEQTGPPAMEAPKSLESGFRGQVVERLRAGSYSYLRVRTDAGRQHWVATMGRGEPVGAAVRVKSMGARNAFRSNRLGRTFERVVFGIVRIAS